MKNQLFPSKIAIGSAFCNRENERKILSENLKNIRHTLIISPRRYGKTSLAMRAIDESNMPFAYINLFNALTNESVVKRFTQGLSALMTTLMPAPQKILKKLGSALTRIRISFEMMGVKSQIQVQPVSQDPLESIQDLLISLEIILKNAGKTGVIFLDEFQDIVKTDFSDELQAVLRDFAQRTETVAWIISGSHRHMLSKIFDDRNKPFYKLCDRINLERIKPESHILFIQKHAKQKWQKIFSEELLNLILKLTESHPYYLNRLCHKLWVETKFPTLQSVQSAWNLLKQEEADSLKNDISLLTKNQRIVLEQVALSGLLTDHTSQETTQKSGLASSSVGDAMEALQKMDFIEVISEGPKTGFRVIDPMIREVLSRGDTL